jgi:hypothetical protein
MKIAKEGYTTPEKGEVKMDSRTAKQLRGQMRQIIQEMLPNLLTHEVLKAIKESNDVMVKSLEKHVKETMKEMQERQKDTLGYLVRQTTKVVDKV